MNVRVVSQLAKVPYFKLEVAQVLISVVWLLLVQVTLYENVLVCVCDSLKLTGVDGTLDCVVCVHVRMYVVSVCVHGDHLLTLQNRALTR